jgi:hypothetical protein
MAKIKDTILLIPDEELRKWIHDFIIREYGKNALNNDVETWYTELGLVMHKSPFTAVKAGSGLTVKAIPSYTAYGDFQGESRYLLCLYGLVCKLTQIILDSKQKI